MNTSILLYFLQDAFFAAIAAIGFGSISNIPLKGFVGSAALAAVGHNIRLFLMEFAGWNIVAASLPAGFAIGVLSLPLSNLLGIKSETLSSPALLPMIPGMYAYRAVQSFILCFTTNDINHFQHYFSLFGYNFFTCAMAVMALVVGIVSPRILFKRKLGNR